MPSANDWLNLKHRVSHIIERTMVDNIPALATIDVDPLHHRYTKEMSGKSSIVNLGVVHENPSTAHGVSQIMDHLQQYSPMENGETQVPILCNGDGLSIERMKAAIKYRARTPTSSSRLEGLLPSPQEFHKEGILLQVKLNAKFTFDYSTGL